MVVYRKEEVLGQFPGKISALSEIIFGKRPHERILDIAQVLVKIEVREGTVSMAVDHIEYNCYPLAVGFVYQSLHVPPLAKPLVNAKVAYRQKAQSTLLATLVTGIISMQLTPRSER